MPSGKIVAVARDGAHHFSKPLAPSIRLRAGLGVDGDAHEGVTVKHRSRVAVDPSQPNLRQVHLIHGELFDELARGGFQVAPGELARTSRRKDSTSSGCRSQPGFISAPRPWSR